VIVVVVMPPTVVETSLTMVLAELPPPPDPELPPADCEDDAEDAADVADVADVDEAAEDDAAVVDWKVEAVAPDEAIALIDMRSSLKGSRGRFADGAPCPLLQRKGHAKQAPALRKIVAAARSSRSCGRNQSPRHELHVLPICPGKPRGCDGRAASCTDGHLVSRPCELERGR
jgi:hypothetical protein